MKDPTSQHFDPKKRSRRTEVPHFEEEAKALRT
jgi:hypothetical protein